MNPTRRHLPPLFVVAAILVFCGFADARPRKAPAGVEAATRTVASLHPLPDGADATQDLLLAIAEHESRFNAAIIRCAIKGDHGLAHGAYQLHPEAFGQHDAQEVCGDDRLQARLAVAVLQRYLDMFPDLGVVGAVRGFASGNPRKDTQAAREILGMWKERRARRGRKPS